MIEQPPSEPAPRPSQSVPRSEPEPPEEHPPVFGTWPRLYAAVLLYLAGLILLFTWFTGAFD